MTVVSLLLCDNRLAGYHVPGLPSSGVPSTMLSGAASGCRRAKT